MNKARILFGTAILIAFVSGLRAQDAPSGYYQAGETSTGAPIWLPGSQPSSRSLSRSSTPPSVRAKVEKLVEALRRANNLKTAEATDEAKAAARKTISEASDQLTELVGQQFDELLQGRENQIKQLRSRIARLESEIDRSRDAKKQIVDLRFKTILNEANGLGFPSSQDNSRMQWNTSAYRSLPISAPRRQTPNAF